MHDFINDLTPPNIWELLRYSLEKTPLLYKDSQRLAISVLKTGEPNIWNLSFSWLGARNWNSSHICLRSLSKKEYYIVTEHFDVRGYLLTSMFTSLPPRLAILR